MNRLFFIIIAIFISLSVFAQSPKRKTLPAITRTIATNDLSDYEQYPPAIKNIVDNALRLSAMHLTYLYGSSNPQNGGMDCSGTIYYLLSSISKQAIPRQADQMYVWLEQAKRIHKTTSHDLTSDEFKQLKPGDLLFWSGTYATDRDVTHVMLYLGKDKNNKPLMFGSSDGRTFKNIKMRGVSVFDFLLPKPSDKAKFVGYGCVPGLC